MLKGHITALAAVIGIFVAGATTTWYFRIPTYELEAKIKSIQEEYDAYRNKYPTLNSGENLYKIRKLQNEFSEKENELEIAKKITKELNIKLKEIENQKEQLEKNLKEADAKLREMCSQKEELERKLKEAPMQLAQTSGGVRQITPSSFSKSNQVKQLENYQYNSQTILIWVRQKALAFRGALSISVTDIKYDKIFLIIGSQGYPNLRKTENIGNTFIYNSNASYEIKIVKINHSKLVEFYIIQKSIIRK